MIKTVQINGNPVLFVVNKDYFIASQTGRTIQGKLTEISSESLQFECPIPGGKVQRQSIDINQIAEAKKL